MILIIDNYDSFTYNLYQLCESLGQRTKVVLSDKINIGDIEALSPDHIIISPGPRTPKDSPGSVAVIKQFYRRLPILGVCLGHQCLGAAFNSSVRPAKRLIHGKTTPIIHSSSFLFKNVPSPFSAARYNSLVLDRVPDGFFVSARDDQNEIMAIEHFGLPLFGVQFHPESFMTENGDRIISNFINAD